MTYHWQRFWCPRDGVIALDADGFLLDPTTPVGRRDNASLVELRELESVPCLVLLGEPGSGKSFALAAERTRTRATADTIHLDLNSYGSELSLERDLFESPTIQAWRQGRGRLTLFLDSIDECLIRVTALAALLVRAFEKLPRDRLRVRLACRTGDWPALLDFELPRLWGKDAVRVLELAPLRREDVKSAASSRGLDSDAFLVEVAGREVVALAVQPITLEFLLNTFGRNDALPNTRTALYGEGCAILCEEHSKSRRAGGLRGSLSPSQRLAIAGRLALLTMTCGRRLIWTEPSLGMTAPDELTLRDVVGGEERVDGVPFEVTEDGIRETLATTALFSSRGSGRMGWAHQSYAEYLAARYVLENRLPIAQVKSLLMHHDLRDQVIPQPHETAAWLASMDSGFFARLCSSDPLVLLRSDALSVRESARAELVASVLAAIERGEFPEDWRVRRMFRKLQHSGLAEQLRAMILDRSRSVAVRRAALEIAQQAVVTDLVGALVGVALDPTEDIGVRVTAADAVASIGDNHAKLRLLPLAEQPDQTDRDDDLKGLALLALCPAQIEAGAALRLATRPRNDSYFGAYSRFLSDLPDMLAASELPEALRWLTGQPSRDAVGFQMGRLQDAILCRGWESASAPEVLEPLAAAVSSRIALHDALFVRDDARSDRPPRDIDRDARRGVLERLLSAPGAMSQQDIVALLFSSPALLRQEDLGWCVAGLDSAPPDRQSSWARSIAELLLWETDADRLDLILGAGERHPVLGELLAPVTRAVDLKSDDADRLRREYERHLEFLRKTEDPLLSPSPPERVDTWLDRFESGELAAWWHLNRDLTLEPRSRFYGNAWDPNLLRTPGWNTASPVTRGRIARAAQAFVLRGDPESEAWLDGTAYYYSALAGYRALRMTEVLDPAWLDALAPEVWLRWAPIVVAYPHMQAGPPDESILRKAYRACPDGVMNAGLRLIDKENAKDGQLFAHRTLAKCWDPRLADVILDKTLDVRLSAAALADLVELGLQRKDGRFVEQGIALLPGPPLDSTNVSRFVELAAALLKHSAGLAWTALWPRLERDEALGRDVITKLATTLAHEGAKVARQLSPDDCATLYIWLEQHFPHEADGQRASGAVSPRESVADFRDAILRHLEECGRADALPAIERIAAALPKLTWLAMAYVAARRAVLRQTWLPPPPNAVLALTRRAESRFVESGDQLLEVVLESLDRLDESFRAETPQAREVWDDRGAEGYFPNDENTLSDYIKRHLHRDLRDRGIVLNREVEVRKSIGKGTGQRTDIHVDALSRSSGRSVDVVKAVVEVKGCWNPEVGTAMQSQLRDRYLQNTDSRHGIYVVGWFACERWSEADSRKAQVGIESLDSARDTFSQQAVALSTSDVSVRAFVLDARLG